MHFRSTKRGEGHPLDRHGRLSNSRRRAVVANCRPTTPPQRTSRLGIVVQTAIYLLLSKGSIRKRIHSAAHEARWRGIFYGAITSNNKSAKVQLSLSY